MELEYTVKPSLWARFRPLLQNWRLALFVGFFLVLFGSFGYTLLDDVLSNGIHNRGTYTEVDLKALGNFHFDELDGSVSQVPPEFRALDGKRVELKGLMWSGMGAGPQVKMFQFVYNIQKCCFGGPPRVQERVFVFVPNGKSVEMHGELVSVIGRLHVQPKKTPDGTVVSLYTLDLESLQPA